MLLAMSYMVPLASCPPPVTLAFQASNLVVLVVMGCVLDSALTPTLLRCVEDVAAEVSVGVVLTCCVVTGSVMEQGVVGSGIMTGGRQVPYRPIGASPRMGRSLPPCHKFRIHQGEVRQSRCPFDHPPWWC